MTLLGNRYPYLFSSREEIDRQISVQGTEWHSDDVSDDDDVILEVVERATGTVKAKLNRLYADVNLASSPWVRHRATIIACYYLSIRRGNVSIYESLYFQALDEIDQLIDGELFLEELPRNNSNPIAVQNYHTDNRFPFSPIRIDMITSTVIAPGQTNVDRIAAFLWF